MGQREPRRTTSVIILVSLVVGVVVFLVLTVVLTAVLDPLIWPSLIVALPIGFLAGSASALLHYLFLTRSPDSRINWRMVGYGTIAVIVAFGLFVGGLAVLGEQRLDETTTSTFEYRVTLAADHTIENATFYVPIAKFRGTCPIGECFVESVRYHRYEPAVEGYDETPPPVEFTYDLVQTDQGRMLSISADRIDVTRVYYRTVENETMAWHERIDESAFDPTNPTMGVQTDGAFTFTVSMESASLIETADPFQTEPLLGQVTDRRAVECLWGPTEAHRCFEYTGLVYAVYDASRETTVDIAIEFTGRNEWFSGGWTGNEYRQHVATEIQGPGTGWYRVPGELEVGVGRYRG